MTEKTPEVIKCPQCHYPIQNLSELYCPRCYTPIISLSGCQGSCASCKKKKSSCSSS